MTRVLRVVTVALVLVVPVVAEAECAWVLWALTKVDGVEQWRPRSSYRELEQCQSAENFLARAGKPGRCLPDTVDPRGPKGK